MNIGVAPPLIPSISVPVHVSVNAWVNTLIPGLDPSKAISLSILSTALLDTQSLNTLLYSDTMSLFFLISCTFAFAFTFEENSALKKMGPCVGGGGV